MILYGKKLRLPDLPDIPFGMDRREFLKKRATCVAMKQAMLYCVGDIKDGDEEDVITTFYANTWMPRATEIIYRQWMLLSVIDWRVFGF